MPNKGVPRSRPLSERFWEKVDQRGPEECWPWLGAHGRKGHGRTAIGRRQVMAAQVAWSLHHGRHFPEGMFALHSCDNPPCVNPAHIRPGTHLDNMADMTSRGRRLKTHCRRGHEYTPENTIVRGGAKQCRICVRASWNKYNRRRAQANVASRLGQALND